MAQHLLDFQYGRLRSKKSIRLARIRSGTGNTRVVIDLVDSYVSTSGQAPFQDYDALSYTWGALAPDKTVLCNGRRLDVTETLLEALKQFRHQTEVVTLWIDQLCICQSRPKEREQQVQMMSDIFTGARRVLVWLGGHEPGSRAGMRLAKQLLFIARDPQLQDVDHVHLQSRLPAREHKGWKGLAAILRRPWFLRTWVVQEVVLNPDVTIVLGDDSLHWKDLEDIVSLLEGPTPPRWQLDLTMSAWELPFSRINRIRLRHQNLFGRNQSQENHDYSDVSGNDFDEQQDLDLLDLLLISRDLGATDPRDKIYALLGLSHNDMIPDYEASPEQVFNEFALHIVGEATRLAPAGAQVAKLSSRLKQVRKALTLLSCAGRPNQSRQLASWIPDWSAHLSARPLFFDPRFNAGGELIDLDWHYETGLHLCGKLIDTVAVAGTVDLTQYCTSDSHELIRNWNEEAKRIAQTRSMRSPGSTANVDAFQALKRELSLCDHGYYQGEALDEQHGTQFRRRRSLLDDPEILHDSFHDARQTLMLGPSRGRVLAVTTTGYICLVPFSAKEGDLLYIILGASVPFVLRLDPKKSSASTFILIGEAYVQGCMTGEHLAMDQWSAVEDIYLQ